MKTYKYRALVAVRLPGTRDVLPSHPGVTRVPRTASSLLPKLAVLIHRRAHPPEGGWCHPEPETVEPEETDNNSLGCLGLAPLQPKRERVDPPGVARNDPGDPTDGPLSCLGWTPQQHSRVE